MFENINSHSTRHRHPHIGTKPKAFQIITNVKLFSIETGQHIWLDNDTIFDPGESCRKVTIPCTNFFGIPHMHL